MDGNGTESWPTAIGKTGTVCFLRLRIGWMISFQTGTLEFGPRRKGGNTSPAAGPSSTRFRWYAIPITKSYTVESNIILRGIKSNRIESNRIESKLMGVVFHRKKRRFGERSIRSRTLLLLCSSTLPPSRLGGFSRPKDRCWMVVLCSRWIGCGSVPLVYQSLRCSSAHTQHTTSHTSKHTAGLLLFALAREQQWNATNINRQYTHRSKTHATVHTNYNATDHNATDHNDRPNSY